MKKGGKTALLRLPMSEPSKKGKVGDKEGTGKKEQSQTVQKRKSLRGQKKQEESISKKLFSSESEKVTDDVIESNKEKSARQKSQISTPKAVETSQLDSESASELNVSLDSSEQAKKSEVSGEQAEKSVGSAKKRTRRGKKNQSEKTPDSSANTNGGLDITLPMEDDVKTTSRGKRKAEKEGISTPKSVETSQLDSESASELNVSLDSSEQAKKSEVSGEEAKKSEVIGTKKRTRRGKKKQPEKKTPDSSANTNGGLDITLPMEEGVKTTRRRKRKAEKEEVVSFPDTSPDTPALQGQRKKRKGKLDTPSGTKKTPMPVGDAQWLDPLKKGKTVGSAVKTSTKKPQGKEGKQGSKQLSAKKRREKAKLRSPYILKCMNIPRSTRAAYLSLFLSEMDLNPLIKIKKLRQRSNRPQTKSIRYALFICKTEKERDALLDLDETMLPSGSTGKEWKLRIVPQMTRQESRSNHGLRITNTPEDVTEKDFKEFFSEKDMPISKAIVYGTDKVAIVFFRTVTDVKLALESEKPNLKGTQMKFAANKGYMNFDKFGRMLVDL